MAYHELTPADRAKGAEASLATRRQQSQTRAIRNTTIWRIADGITEAEIADNLLAQTAIVIDRAMESEVPIESSLDLVRHVQSAETLYKMYRLATGQSTSNAATANVTGNLADRLTALEGERSATVDVPGPTTTGPAISDA